MMFFGTDGKDQEMRSSHLSTKEYRRELLFSCIFPAHGKIVMKWHQVGPGGFFPTKPDLADILGNMDFDFENIYFFGSFSDPKFPYVFEVFWSFLVAPASGAHYRLLSSGQQFPRRRLVDI